MIQKVQQAGAVCDGCGAAGTGAEPLVCEKKRIEGVVTYMWYCPACFTQPAVDGGSEQDGYSVEIQP